MRLSIEYPAEKEAGNLRVRLWPHIQRLWGRSEMKGVRTVWHKLRRRQTKWGEDWPEQGAGWYDEIYLKPNTTYRAHYTQSAYYFLWTVIADRMPPSAAVLEIGCGTGQLASFLVERGLASYLGFDFSPQAVALAKGRSPSLEFVVDDARYSGLLDRPDYNVVVCTEVLEHIEADLEVLRRVRPGTRCFLTVPNFPYPSHVRHFESAEAVSLRYGELFHDHQVTEFAVNPSGDRFFLLDGVRNNERG
jgi:2-polyprenyl-3-methyl-5-hydroxy-6-metoxy-1,4-benzoquinol methylase